MFDSSNVITTNHWFYTWDGTNPDGTSGTSGDIEEEDGEGTIIG